ncbi:hypothetical protein SCUCBS95973_007417 [Sporothrix curviconia]|uniref:Major facilitator superfamily (MFS) profile domain-containing protein n=1 Tax=Sporothrix curviconia TaxID=1260050 RepID=A0ABP0CFI9_9PEZI
MSLALYWVWVGVAFFANTTSTLIVDRLGRRRCFMIGLVGCLTALIGETVASSFLPTTNKGILALGVFFIFFFIPWYGVMVDGVMYTYVSEIWAAHIRSEGVALSMTVMYEGYWVATIAVLQAAPTSFANCGYKFYIVFISCTVVMWVFAAFCLPETCNIPMEEMGRLFGDEVAGTLEDQLKQRGAWPWPRAVNPHYPSVSAASADWLRSFKLCPPQAQFAFDRCNYGLLAGMAYPNHSPDDYRIGCDLMNLFFVVEDGTDNETPDVVAQRMASVKQAMHGTVYQHGGEWRGVDVARQFWSNALRHMRRSTAMRFRSSFCQYLDAVVAEATDRAAVGKTTPVYTLDSYVALRRKTVGTQPSFAVTELALGHLDEAAVTEAVTSPSMDALSMVVTDVILIGNDLVSYNKERPSGAVHNIVTVVLRNPPPDSTWPKTAPSTISSVQDAMDWVAAYHDELADRFFVLYRQATAGNASDAVSDAVSDAAKQYAYGLGNWVRANDQWSFESCRYFGARGAEVQKTRAVELMPLGL